MELKFIILDFFCLKLGSSNCTFMELKYVGSTPSIMTFKF